MTASEMIKKRIIIESLALLFLIGAIIYAIVAVKNEKKNEINNIDGIVTIFDDTTFEKMKPLSDGEGLDTKPITYSVTNNNSNEKDFDIILNLNTKDEKIINAIRLSIDGLKITNLNELEKNKEGYILASHTLKPGYTKRFQVKAWYQLGTEEKITKKNIKFKFSLSIKN